MKKERVHIGLLVWYRTIAIFEKRWFSQVFTVSDGKRQSDFIWILSVVPLLV